MVLLISNCGNTNGINLEKQNTIDYVQSAIDENFIVVVDVWKNRNNNLFLGTYEPSYLVDLNFLKKETIICRAKTLNTFEYLLLNNIHCFMDGKDDFILTSQKLIWTYPGKQIVFNSIINMPEYLLPDISSILPLRCKGICSNYIQGIKKQLENNIYEEEKKC